MPLFAKSSYYVHSDLDDLITSPRGVNNDLLIQAKSIARNRSLALNKLPPLFSYPRAPIASESSSIASSDWLTTVSEPVTVRKHLLPKLNETPTTNGKGLPRHAVYKNAQREQVKVNFVRASDLQDLIRRGKTTRESHVSDLPKHTLDIKKAQSSYAWSNKPLIKKTKISNRKDNGQPQWRTSRNRANLSEEGGLKGKNTGSNKEEGASCSQSRNEHDFFLDLDEESITSARSMSLPDVEGEILSNRKKTTRKLVKNAIATLQKYDHWRTDPLENVPKIKKQRKTSTVLSLDSIPESENEIQDDISDDGWSSYSGDSWSSARSSGRRNIRDRHGLNLSWRPKSPVVSKPGLAMIPENDQNVTSVFKTKSSDVHVKNYRSPRSSSDIDNTVKSKVAIDNDRKFNYRNDTDNERKFNDRNRIGDSYVRAYINESHIEKKLRSTKILSAREKLKNTPKRMKFLKS